jgi:hypothetical protein
MEKYLDRFGWVTIWFIVLYIVGHLITATIK